ncbi:MAG: hypothetical protein RJB13_2249 [Pseudomonadota bacterium]
MSFLKMGVKNTLSNWRHSIGAVLSVAIGYASLTMFNGYISVIQDMYEDNYRQRSMFGDVFIEKTTHGSRIDFEESKISPSEQAFIDNFFNNNISLIDTYSKFLIISGLANNGRTSSIFWGFAYDFESGKKLREPSWLWNSKAGRPLDQLTDDSVMLGQDIGDAFGCKPEKEERLLTKVGGYSALDRPFSCDKKSLQLSVTTDSGQVNAMKFNVGALGGVGLRGIDSWYLMMSLNKAQQLFDTDNISHIRLRLKNKGQFDRFVKEFNSEAKQNNLELEAFDWREHVLARVYKRTMSLFLTFRNFVSAVILTISGMSVLNSIVKSVTERRREIGTLRSLGFRRSAIKRIFAIEGLIVGLVGSAVGAVFSHILSLFINQFEFIYYAGFLSDPVPFVIGNVLNLYLISLGISCIISVLASYVASKRAAMSEIPQLLAAT